MAKNEKANVEEVAEVTEAVEIEQSAEDMAEERHFLLEAPIAELAERAGVEIDEAVKMRVAAAIEAAPPRMEISVRPIEPKGNLYGFAKVNIGGVSVNDFKIVKNKDGEFFVGMPSKKDATSRTGFRNTAYVDKDMLEDFNTAVIGAYHAEVERVQARAAAIGDKPRIADQVAKAGKQAAEHNAARPAPAKGGKEMAAELG